MPVWKWAQDKVNFALAPSYETPLRGPYDPEFCPFWKEPADAINDPSISEVWVLKCSRAGGSENVILNPMRYAVARSPCPILYVSADQKSVERFMESRIKDGFRCSSETAAKYRRARVLEHEIYFEDMDLIVTWPKAKGAFKQSGYKLIFGDEVSTWPSYSADMLRKRTDTYSFSHIIGISSPDPQNKRASTDDPIFVEFDDTDKRYWFMPDPKTGNQFRFEMGTKDSVHGLKWDNAAKQPDGTWDMDLVYKSAHYVTPDGTRIENSERLTTVSRGEWKPTATGRTCKRGYHINSFYMPFKSGDFGRIAVAFLTATQRGTEALRIFVYEYLAEPWTQDVERVYDDQVTRRVGEYVARTSFFDKLTDYAKVQRARMLTVDVQQSNLWYVVREWCLGGDSCLIEWGYCVTWEDVDAIAIRNKVEAVLVDSGYPTRKAEVYEECIRRRMVPTKGDDHMTDTDLVWKKSDINPYEGTRRANLGESLGLVLYRTDIFKQLLVDRIRGDTRGWWVYRGIERDYCMQITAEERTPKGWIKRRKDNHVFDLEAAQILAALAYGYLSKADLPESKPSESSPED